MFLIPATQSQTGITGISFRTHDSCSGNTVIALLAVTMKRNLLVQKGRVVTVFSRGRIPANFFFCKLAFLFKVLAT